MKRTEWELQGGLKFQIETPETVEEYNALAGTRPADANATGIAVLDDAIDNTMYRGPFADVRQALAKRVEQEYSDVPRNTKPHPNSEKAAKGETVYDESEGKYLNRVAGVKNIKVADFQKLLDEVMEQNGELAADHTDKIKFDPSQRERRGPSSAEPGKRDYEAADALIAQGHKKLLISLSKISEITGSKVELQKGDSEEVKAANRRTVALAYREYRQNPVNALKA